MRKIIALAIVAGLLIAAVPALSPHVEAAVYNYEIILVTRTGPDQVTVKLQVRFCSACNPNHAGDQGCEMFTHGYPPPYYPYQYFTGDCYVLYPGRYIGVRLRDEAGNIVGVPHKLGCTPMNWPLNQLITASFVFSGIALSGISKVIAEADIYCSWCGHWYPEPKSLNVAPLKVVLDPGHAPADGFPKDLEYQICKGVADRLKPKLEAKGMDVYLTDPASISERVKQANNLKPAIFVSLHGNAYQGFDKDGKPIGTARGTEIWVYRDNDSKQQAADELDIAVRVAKGLSEAIGSTLRAPCDESLKTLKGIKEKCSPWPGGIPILTGVTASPAILAEIDFFDYGQPVTYKGVKYDNMTELMKTAIWQEDAAQGIYNGIIGYFNQKGLTVTAKCPVDLLLTDPDGLRICKEFTEIPGASYLEVDIDGEPGIQIRIPDRKIGDYLIEVIPKPGALPTDTFTLEISLFGESMIIARNVQIGDIPAEPYVVVSTETQLIPLIIPAEMDFDPDVLNLRTRAGVVTAYIELPEGHDVQQIDVSSIRLNGTVTALEWPYEVGDYNDNGIPDLMVKFDRTAVHAVVEVGESVEITISGEVDGIPFSGTDMIRVIGP